MSVRIKPYRLLLFTSNRFNYAQVLRKVRRCRGYSLRSVIDVGAFQHACFTPYIMLSSLYYFSPLQQDGHIMCSASTIEKDIKNKLASVSQSASNKEAGALVGSLIAERALGAGITGVEWNPKQSGQRYHGRIKAIVDAMRKSGLPLI